MMFLHQKSYQKHWILLKTIFEISLFLTKEVHYQTAAFIYYKYGYSSHADEAFKTSYIMWSHLLLGFFFHFSVYCFRKMW